jgi:3-oxoacyl-(acyl-carrier-protein) synthase
MNRVYIRGVGAVTPLGSSWYTSRQALATGRSAVSPVTAFDVRGFPCTTAAAISNVVQTDADRRLTLLRMATREAWDAADVNAADPERIGIFVGAESGRASFATILQLARAAGGTKSFDHAAFGRNAAHLAAELDASIVSPAAVTSNLAREFSAMGPAQTLSLACASSAAAIAEASRAIRLGVCDVALCGGVGADVDPFMLAGFGKVGALSAHGISRPFDTRRDGFVVGEGAAMIVLCKERGGAIAELVGEGRSLDAHHLTAPDPEGHGMELAMRTALRNAGAPGAEYIQAHGTSTPLNDAVEMAAMHRVFGESMPHVSSVKGALGHAIAGAGALGFLCALEAVERGVLLPTAGLTEVDPGCKAPHVMGKAIQRPVRVALSNAFAFGGVNCSLVIRRLS